MNLYVMTAPFGAGKTTWIARMLDAACERKDLRIAGVYTPAVFERGVKTAIDAVLLPSRERFTFATRKTRVEHGSNVLGWNFRKSALERVNAHLASCTDCDLFVVDELGPLELERAEGYTQALELLDGAAVTCALVVVRPTLIEAARERWKAFETLTPESDIVSFLDHLRPRRLSV